MDTHYNTLGVEKNATLNEIKKAWREIVLECHPDKNPGKEKEEKFLKAKEAYEIIGDPEKRKKYDLGLNSVEGSFHDFSSKFNPFDRFEFRNVYYPGKNFEKIIEISLEDAFKGTSKKMKIETHQEVTCPSCKGKRMAHGSYMTPCTSCSGSGRKFSLFQNQPEAKCHVCYGHGDTPRIPCFKCSGKGTIRFEKEIDIKIPQGVENGQKLKIAGMGGTGNPPGDLFIIINIINDPDIYRNNSDIHIERMIPWNKMILGGPHIIELFGIKYTVQIPQNSNSGTVLRKQGAGFPGLNGHPRGDLYMSMLADLPKLKTARAKKLAEELAEETE